MKPVLNAPGTNRLKLNCDILLSTFAFNFNSCHYTVEPGFDTPSTLSTSSTLLAVRVVGRRSLTLSDPC